MGGEDSGFRVQGSGFRVQGCTVLDPDLDVGDDGGLPEEEAEVDNIVVWRAEPERERPLCVQNLTTNQTSERKTARRYQTVFTIIALFLTIRFCCNIAV